MSFSPPPGGPPYPPQQPPWPPQQQWSPGPPPKKRGNGWKWTLGGLALIAVIGVTVAVTISVTRDDTGNGPNPSGNTFGLASADDKGPANIITEDPTCAAWRPVADGFADATKMGWNKRDPAISAEEWTIDQRAIYEEVGHAARSAAEQTVPLAKLTPHRVMRELYEQFIAYARAYSDLIPSYTPRDNHVSGAVITISGALTYVCSAVEWKSAQARAPFIPPPPAPSQFAPLTDPNEPQRFMDEPDPTCAAWDRLLNAFDANTKAWQALESSIPASDWTPNQRAVIDAVIPVMERFARDIEETGRTTANPVIQDFATFAAQYRRAYAQALPTYTPADSFLATASLRVTSTLYEACQAVVD